MSGRVPKALHHVLGDAFDPKALGRMFRELRERVGLTQTALGVKMGGALYQNISRLEVGRGTREPTLTFLSRYARACGWELKLTLQPRQGDAGSSDVLEGDPEPPPPAPAKAARDRRSGRATAAKTKGR